MVIGYFLAPFCAMLANSIFGAYLNRYYVDVLGWTKFGAFATTAAGGICDLCSTRKSSDRKMDRQYQNFPGKSKTLYAIAAPMVDRCRDSSVYDTD